jgi:hypothetical protein
MLALIPSKPPKLVDLVKLYARITMLVCEEELADRPQSRRTIYKVLNDPKAALTRTSPMAYKAMRAILMQVNKPKIFKTS